MLLQLVKICECVQVCVGMHADIALEAAKTYFLAPYFFFLLRNNNRGNFNSENERKIFVMTDIISA